MLVAAKFGDPVLGVDIHMVLVPVPPAPPIPTPLPHPFIGVVFDPIGLAMGCLLGAVFGGGGPVLINSMPCGNTGTEVKGVPHFPMPPGISFAPNDIPGNEGVLFMGSQTVTMGGDTIARLTDMVISCNFPINLPTSVCLAVPMGPPVLVGGPPSINFMAAATQMIRTKWVSNQLHALLKAKPGSRLSKVICFFTGHPVDVMTGEVLTSRTDFVLDGAFPLRWTCEYASRDRAGGPLGPGWRHPLEACVIDEGWRLHVRLPDGRTRWLPPLADRGAFFDPLERLTLARDGDTFTLTTRGDGQVRRFRRLGPEPRWSLVRVEDRFGNGISCDHAGGRLVLARDDSGRTLRFGYRGDHLVAVTATAFGAEATLVTYAYDADGHLAAAIASDGATSRYGVRNGVLVEETDPAGLSFFFEYDWEHPDGWCVRTWGDGGIYDRRLTYDKHRHVTAVTDGDGGVTQYFGNADGVVVRVLDPEGGEHRYAYDDALRRIEEVAPHGGVNRRVYNALGDLLEETDALGQTARWEVRDDGGITAVHLPDGTTYRHTLDRRGGCVETVDPCGGRWTLIRDGRGRVVRWTSPGGRWRTADYDDRGDLIAESDWEARLTHRRHDPWGRVTQVEHPDGTVTRNIWDARGRPLGTVGPDGVETTLRRDAAGRVVEITRGGHTQRVTWAFGDRVATVSDALGERAALRYDREGRVCEVHVAGETHRFRRDRAGRVVGEETAGGRSLTHRRDRSGRVVASQRGRGPSITATWDALDRLVEVRSPSARLRYAFDALGRLREAATDDDVITLVRDPLGRVVEERVGVAVVQSEYDADGNRVRMRTNLGLEVATAYDGNGCPLGADTRCQKGITWSHRVQRDEAGREVLRTLLGGVSVRRARRFDGLPISLEVHRDEAPLRSVAYRWRDAAAMEARLDSERGPTFLRHDARGHACEVRTAEGVQVREADARGGVQTTVDGSPRTRDGDGALLAQRDLTVEYDDAGQPTALDTHEGRWRLRWDALGQLREVHRPGAGVVRYRYDALGRRTEKDVDGAVTRFTWDLDRLVHARSPDRALSWVHDEDGWSVATQFEDAEPYGVVSELQALPVMLIDQHGTPVWEGVPDASRGVRSDNPDRVPWRFANQYEDPETGFFYNRFRYYLPQADAYLSPDPLGLDGGLDRYAYVPDPFTWIDPLGLVRILTDGPVQVNAYPGPSVGGSEHAPLHAHVHEGKLETRVLMEDYHKKGKLVGSAGDVYPGDPPMTKRMRKTVNANLPELQQKTRSVFETGGC